MSPAATRPAASPPGGPTSTTRSPTTGPGGPAAATSAARAGATTSSSSTPGGSSSRPGPASSPGPRPRAANIPSPPTSTRCRSAAHHGLGQSAAAVAGAPPYRGRNAGGSGGFGPGTDGRRGYGAGLVPAELVPAGAGTWAGADSG